MSLALYQLLGSFSLLYSLNLITAACFLLFILPSSSVSVICVDVTLVSVAGKASHSLRYPSGYNSISSDYVHFSVLRSSFFHKFTFVMLL